VEKSILVHSYSPFLDVVKNHSEYSSHPFDGTHEGTNHWGGPWDDPVSSEVRVRSGLSRPGRRCHRLLHKRHRLPSRALEKLAAAPCGTAGKAGGCGRGVLCVFWVVLFKLYYVKVSQNGGTPESSMLIGCSIINHPCWEKPISGWGV
jgi:hypothetical protein